MPITKTILNTNYLLNETVNKYFDSITTYSGLVRKCKTRNGNYVGAMIIPIIVP